MTSSREHHPADPSSAVDNPGWLNCLESETHVHFVDVDEHRLRVVEIGVGEPVLLIHGFADSVYTWHRNLQAFVAAGFRVVAYDHPGHGESALPAGFRFGVDDLARLAVGLLDTLGVERTHLIGHSMGGGVGLQLAIHCPERLHQVVLEAPVCYHAPFRPFVYLACCPLVGALVRRVLGPWLVGPVLHSAYGDDTLLTPAVLTHYHSAFRRAEYPCACVGSLRDYWNRAFARAIRKYHTIRVPLQLVWGERDMWIDQRCALRLAADTGVGLTIIDGAGHIAHQARPTPFNQVAVSFLGSG